MKWRVDIRDKHGHMRTEAMCESWWAAHRLVVGITGYTYEQVADQTTQFMQEFDVQWYKEFIYVRKAER